MIELPTCCGCHLQTNWIQSPQPSYYTNTFTPKEGLLEEEKLVLQLLGQAWNAFMALEKKSVDDMTEFRQSIHDCQQLIALRVARRADPEIWNQPE